MTAISLESTDVNLNRNIPALVQSAETDWLNRPSANNSQVARFVINDISDISISEISETKVFSVPITLHFAYVSFSVITLFFFSQFVLTFFGSSYISGFSGLVGTVAFGGLFKVAERINGEIRKKGYIQ